MPADATERARDRAAAQWIAHQTSDLEVAGSSPVWLFFARRMAGLAEVRQSILSDKNWDMVGM